MSDDDDDEEREKRRKLILEAKEAEDGFDEALYEYYRTNPDPPSLEEIMEFLDEAIAATIEEVRGSV